jgi:cytoskeletal protein CcmA (bactofilin family)
MWNRRKDEEYPPKPANVPSSSAAAQATREVPNTVSSALARGYDSGIVSGSATIGKAVMIKGQIFSREDLMIDGEMEGTVEAYDHRVTIGPNGKVQAGIKAREIVVLGNVHGNVEASDKIDIRKDARLVGDIKTSRIVIEDGAYFKGSIDIAKTEPKPQRPPAPATQQQPQPAQQNQVATTAERK